MTTSERLAAFFAYLLLPIGWLIVLLFGRRSAAAVFHCKQAIALVALVLAAFAAWVGVGWILTWIPYRRRRGDRALHPGPGRPDRRDRHLADRNAQRPGRADRRRCPSSGAWVNRFMP